MFLTGEKLPPVTPGEILREEFLEPLGVSPYRLAKDLGVTPTRIHEILSGKRAITADTALRLGRYFGMTAAFWMNLQARHDLEMAQNADLALESIQPLARPTPKELAAV
jgi:addiction module HigA family antidote